MAVAKLASSSATAADRGAARAPARGRDTKALILNAAEALFSVHGYDGVSMRAITDRAGVRLALVTYHFDTKELLFEAVIARRAEVLNERRLAALGLVLAHGKPSLREILEAFMRPYLDLRVSHDAGWRNYSLLIAQLAQTNRWLPLVDRYFNPTAQVFLAAFCNALPKAPRPRVSRCFVFAIQLMVSELAGNGRVDTLSDGVLDSDDVKAVYEDMIPFLLGGFERLLQKPPAAPRA
ncbi:TetR/AcrR family transcriptional regulator [Acidisoma sp. C75]